MFGGMSLSGVRLTTESFFTLWRNHGDVFGAVREISQSVGVAGYYFENVNDADKDPNPQSVAVVESAISF